MANNIYDARFVNGGRASDTRENSANYCHTKPNRHQEKVQTHRKICH